MPVACCSSRSSWRISACTVTSSAVVGSSAISSCGRPASARAMLMRWAMPPEISCGYEAQHAVGVGQLDLLQQLDGSRSPWPARAEPLVHVAMTSRRWLPTVCVGSRLPSASWAT